VILGKRACFGAKRGKVTRRMVMNEDLIDLNSYQESIPTHRHVIDSLAHL
jgi:hypothetical protein